MPYGYRRNGSSLIVDSNEATAVRLIFERARLGATKSVIAKLLVERELTRRNGKLWTRRQVRAILSREALYREGIFRYGETTGRDSRVGIVAPYSV